MLIYFISVSADVSGALRGLGDLNTATNRAGAEMLLATQAARPFFEVFEGVAGAFAGAVQAAADFDTKLTEVRGNTLLTDEGAATMRDTILDLGAKGPVALNELADGYMHVVNLLGEGVDATGIMDAAFKSATSAGADFSDTAEILAKTLNEFNIPAAEASRVMDMIHVAAAEGNMTLQQFDTAFGPLGAAAAALGVPLDQVISAMSALTEHGFSASQAAVQVRDELLHIVNPSDAAMKAIKALAAASGNDGLVADFSAAGLSSRGLTGVMDDTKAAMDAAGLSIDQQNALWLKIIPNIRGGLGAATLNNAAWDDFHRILGDVDNSMGTTDAAFQRIQQTANYQWGEVTNKFKELSITLGEQLQPILVEGLKFLNFWLTAFMALPQPIQDAIAVAIGIAGALSGLIGVLIILGPLLDVIGVGFGIMAGVIGPLLVPLAALAAAAALLYAAWQDDFGGIREVTQQVWDAIQPAFANIANFVMTIKDLLAPAFTGLQSAAGPFIEQMSQALAPILAQLPGLVKSLGDELNKIGEFFGYVADTVRFLVGGDFGAFMRLLEDTSVPIGFVQALALIHGAFETIGPVVEMVSQAINFLITGNIDRLVELMQEGLPPQFAAALQFIHDVLAVQVQVWKDVIGGIVEFVGYLNSGDLQGAWNSILNTIGKLQQDILPLWNEFLTVVGNLLAALGPWIADRGRDTWSALLAEWNALPSQLSAFWENVKAEIGGFMQQLPGYIASAAGNVWQYLIGDFSSLPGQTQVMWPGILSNLGGLMSELPGFLATAAGDIWQFLIGVFSSLPGVVQAIWPDILSNLGGLMSEIPGALATAAGDVWQYLIGTFSTLPGLVQAIWPGILDNLGGLMQTIAGALAAAAGDVWQYLIGTFTTLPGLVNDIWPGLMDSLGGLMSTIGGTLAAAAGNVWGWFRDSAWNLGNPGGIPDAINNILGFIGQAIGGIPDMLTNLGDIWSVLIDGANAVVSRIGDILGGIKQAIIDTFNAVPTWFSSQYGTSGSGGGTGGFGGDPGTGGTIGTTSPLISIGTLIISSQEEADAFLNLVAQAVLASARRVTVPATGGNPALG